MRRTLLSIVAVTGLLWPLGAAAAPAAVLGVEASVQDGTILVSWHTPKRADDIMKYRIYFSHESILDNEGNFDDTVTTEGTETSYTFEELPPYDRVFFAVVGVDAKDQESPAFGNEASVEVPRQEESSSSEEFIEEQPAEEEDQYVQEEQGVEEEPAPSEEVGDTEPQQTPPTPSVTNLLLSSQRVSNSYLITATFDVPEELDVLSFDVLQSIDGGRTFGATQTVEGDARRMEFSSVPSGIFGVLIRARLTDGTYSRSVFATLPLAGGSAVPAPIASVSQGQRPLTSTGAGIGVALVASGAVMGWRKARKTRGEPAQSAL